MSNFQLVVYKGERGTPMIQHVKGFNKRERAEKAYKRFIKKLRPANYTQRVVLYDGFYSYMRHTVERDTEGDDADVKT